MTDRKLRIGLVMQGDGNWVGGVEYIKNIIFALATLPTEVKNTFEIILICHTELDPSLYSSIISEVTETIYISKSNKFQRLQEELDKFIFNEYASALVRCLSNSSTGRLDFLYPHFSLRYGDYTGFPWIPDFQHKCLPLFFSKQIIADRDKYFNYLASNAQNIVVSSESAKQDFERFYPDSQSELTVLSFATFPLQQWYIDDSEDVLQKYNLPSRFFLVSNQFWQHKNHTIIFEAVSILKQQGLDVNLVCTGKIQDPRNPLYTEKLINKIDNLGLSDRIYLLGLIPKIDQIQLVRQSLAMIQPSLFEGWSTVVEDARCFGKQIAISNISVHLEQSPPKAKFFNPDQPQELADILHQWWDEHKDGYDRDAELAAYQENRSRIQALGSQFLGIAQKSLK